MTMRQLLAELELQTAAGVGMEDEVLVLVGRELRRVESSYRNHAYILIAGRPVQ